MVNNDRVPCIFPTYENGPLEPNNPTPLSEPQPLPTYENPTVPVEELNTPPPSKRPRSGRPPGAKNKPKSLIIDNSVKSVLFQIPSGNDIIACLTNFARCHQVNLTVLSASGIVSDVHIRHPFPDHSGLPLIYRGLHQMISLSGTYTNFSSPSIANEPGHENNFTIQLAGSQLGATCVGIVAGTVVAASPVVVNALVFKKFGCKAFCFDGNMLVEESGGFSSYFNDPNSSGSTSTVVSSTNSACVGQFNMSTYDGASSNPWM